MKNAILPILSLILFSEFLCAFEADYIPNKKLADKTIVFVLRKQYPPDHHNTGNIFQRDEVNTGSFLKCAGNSKLVAATFDGEGKIKSERILASSENGLIRDAEVSYDASSIVFAMRNSSAENYKIYEYGIKGGKIKRLTNLDCVSDIEPVYLPTGEIVFSSTRAQKYCACNRHIMANLYRMNSDGSNITQIGNSIEFENHPTVMSDGRILYTRWEYVDRNFGGAQGIWTCNPDGTRHSLYWGQSTGNPILNPVQLADGKIAAVMSSCHDRPWGAVVVIDRTIDIEGRRSVVKIFPENAADAIGKGIDAIKASVPLKFEDIEILSPNDLVVTRRIDEKSDKTALYILDIDSGKLEEIVRVADGERGVFDAKILSPRQSPKEIPEQRSYEGGSAFVYVGDVYEGTNMENIKRGDIKYLRIIEDNPKMNWSGGCWTAQGAQAPALNYDDFDNKTIYGIVPVEADGSAYFKIPADKFVYLQALDKDKKMLQSMRSGLSALPGEIVSCAGCHESRMSPPPTSLKASFAVKRAPSKIEKTPSSGELFSYVKNIQPILDRHCVKCHDFGKTGAKKIILAGDTGLIFNKSYTELHSKNAVTAIGAGGNKVQPANTWGAKQSKIVRMVDRGHSGVKLARDEYETLCQWIDINAPYYDVDDSVYFANPGGRPPITREELFELLRLCGHNKKWYSSRLTSDVNKRNYPNEIISFSRPKMSEILKPLEVGSDAYVRALAIIERGAARLSVRPREDMAGYSETEKSKFRYEKFGKLRKLEALNRNAIAGGKKMFDPENLNGL